MGTLTLFLSLLILPQERVDVSQQPRSLYLPVRFNVCEHFNYVTMYLMTVARDEQGKTIRDEDDQIVFENEQPLANAMPVTKTFQFTYYPSLRKEGEPPILRPDLYLIKIEGSIDGDYENFQFITLTSERIYLSRQKSFELDSNQRFAKRFSFNRDVRYPMQYVKINCDKYPHEDEKEVAKTTKENQK